MNNLVSTQLKQGGYYQGENNDEFYKKYFDYIDEVSKDEKSILNFMRFSGQLYKYKFEEILYIYGQNQEATFVADYDTWKSIGRYVKSGSKAIKYLSRDKTRFLIKNVFDVSQTSGKEYNFPDWHFDEDLLNDVLDKISDEEEKTTSNNIEKIEKICGKLLKDDDDYRKIVLESSKYIIANKLGINTENEDVEFVKSLVNNQDLIKVMIGSIKLNLKVLRDINHVKKQIISERGINYGKSSELSSKRRATREIWRDDVLLSGRREEDRIHENDDGRNITSLLQGEGQGGVRTSRKTRERNAGEKSSFSYVGYSDENKTSKQDKIASGRDSESTSNIQLNIFDIKEKEPDINHGFFSVSRNTEEAYIKVENPSEVVESIDTINSTKEIDSIEVNKSLEIEGKSKFTFNDDVENFYGNTNIDKIRDNISAIKLVKVLEKENRLATKEEQQVIAKYIGWGGLFDVFDERNNKYQSETKELKALLSEEEYTSARNSILTAYYTDPVVIRKIYKTIERLGFKGGKILDPAMGTGNFFSAMPKDIKENSKLYGVELDSITGSIAKHLHQESDIQIKGFEDTNFEDKSFDIVVGNVPFDSVKIKDKKYDKEYQIHDYFIKKSIDLVKEDGIIALITSTGTLDKKLNSYRKELSKEVELLGAIRLPSSAFKKIANTNVTTDILFFKKSSKEYKGEYESNYPSWVYSEVNPEYPVRYNNYFIENPNQILGDIEVKNFHGQTLSVKAKEDISLYDLLEDRLKNINSNRAEGYVVKPQLIKESLVKESIVKSDLVDANEVRESLIKPEEPNLEERLEVVEQLKEDGEQEKKQLKVENYKKYTFIEEDNEIYYVGERELQKQDLSSNAKEKMKSMIALRNTIMEVIEYQQLENFSQPLFEEKLKILNKQYDDFVKKNGYLNSKTNTRLFREDDMFPLLLSVENKRSENEYEKADIFYKATIRPKIIVNEVDNAINALNLSISRRFKVDLYYIQSLYKKDVDEIIKELEGYIFINPLKYAHNSKIYDYYEHRDEYLTGNVKEKLKEAKLKNEEYPGVFAKNIIELEKVIPKDLKPSEISYKIGASWVSEKYYKDFIFEVFETPYRLRNEKYGIDLEYNKFSDTWFIKGKGYDSSVIAINKYGIERASAYKIFEDCLNLRNTEVRDPETYTDKDGKEKIKYVINPKQTMLAREKQEKIQEVFKNWLFKDQDRAKDLLRIYNDRFNCIRPRMYDGNNLEFTGMNEQFELRGHQKNVVARIIHEGRALMAHVVGAGKTASMISAGMFMKEQKLIKKPLFVVPNHLTHEFGSELLRFFPSKKVLITSKRDFETKNRKKFVSRIATGNYDAVIIGHSQFERINMSKEYRTGVLEKEIKVISDSIEEEKRVKGDSWSIKQMIRFEKILKKQLEGLQNEKIKDNILNFEQLGVDFIFVDEAHIYKNLFTYTKLKNVVGVNTSSSLRAMDMYFKTQYLLEKNNCRGVVFATGTPISNSMGEMYTMQRYLQPDLLRETGVESFDSWASTFGEITSSLEITPEGSGYQIKNRFAKFHNLPELMNGFNLVADIQTADMLDLPVPKLKGDKAQIIVVEPSQHQLLLMDEFVERAEKIRTNSVEPEVDNMLKLTHEAKLMAIDPRLLDETLSEEDAGGKLKACCENVFEIYERTNDKKSTQMIFSDVGTPKSNKFNVYDEIKRQLIGKGIPEEEITFIHNAKGDKQREDLFDKVRRGEVRILLGSTEKVGTGTNVQNKLIAAHHIDCPWRPSDLIQRDGRVVRQGNENKEVEIYRYVTKDSFDSYCWQIQEQKLTYISQVMTGKSISRSCDDLDETVLSASEVKAIATGNPFISEKMHLDIEVAKLRLMKASYVDEQIKLKEDVETHYPRKIEELVKRKEKLEKDIATINRNGEEDFNIIINNKSFNERSEAAKELFDLALESSKENDKLKIGKFKGLEVYIKPYFHSTYIISAEGELSYSSEISIERGIGGLIKLENAINNLPKKVDEVSENIDEYQNRIKQAKEQIGIPFEKEGELEKKIFRQSEINILIGMDSLSKKTLRKDEENTKGSFIDDIKKNNKKDELEIVI